MIVEVAEDRRSAISASDITAPGARYCCRMVTDKTGRQNRMCWPRVGLSTGSDGQVGLSGGTGRTRLSTRM